MINKISLVKPRKIYLSFDGPRKNNRNDISLIKEAKDVISLIDWNPSIKILDNVVNLGSKYAPAKAITWFFENEEEGIVLEDDISPSISFFEFCDLMLERYRENPRISSISGHTGISDLYRSRYDYYYSIYVHCWGWAGWRRSWKFFSFSNEKILNSLDDSLLKKISGNNKYFVSYWMRIKKQILSGKINTAWDYYWTFNCWVNGSLTIMPNYTLVKNIGFGSDSTHTKTNNPPSFVRNAIEKDFPLNFVAPDSFENDINADRLTGNAIFGISPVREILRSMKYSLLERM